VTAVSHRTVSTVIQSTARAHEVLTTATATFDEGAIALISTPRQYLMLRLSGSVWADAVGATAIDDSDRLGDAFDVRVFDAKREWRWRYSANGSAVYEVGEREHNADDVQIDDATVLEPTGYSRQMLGRPTGSLSDDGCWVRVAESAIGAIDVPMSHPLPPTADVSTGWLELTAVEYVSVNESGSTFVVGERWTGIRWTTTTERAAQS
jgi:CRISPR-associated protein (TIGR03984 family)